MTLTDIDYVVPWAIVALVAAFLFWYAHREAGKDGRPAPTPDPAPGGDSEPAAPRDGAATLVGVEAHGEVSE